MDPKYMGLKPHDIVKYTNKGQPRLYKVSHRVRLKDTKLSGADLFGPLPTYGEMYVVVEENTDRWNGKNSPKHQEVLISGPDGKMGWCWSTQVQRVLL